MTVKSLSELERFPRRDDASRDSPMANLARQALSVGEAMLGAEADGLVRTPRKSPMTKARAIILGSVLAVVGLYGGLASLGADSKTPGIVTIVVFGFFALLAFGMVPQGDPRGSFRLINATVMTRAERPTADAWVHLAPTQAARMALVLGVILGSLGLLITALSGVLQVVGVMPKLNSATNSVFLLLISVVVAALGCLGLWISVLLLGRRQRNGSFGTRPSGIALGESSVAVRVPGKDIEIPWAQIKSVEPVIVPVRDAEDLCMIRLVLSPGGSITDRVQMLSADGYQVPTDALYTSLRWYHAHPEARRELGRVEGQQRLQSWCDQAVAKIR